MKKEQWYSLSKADQEIWDKLSEKAKAIILQCTIDDNRTNFPTPKSSNFVKPKTSVNFHDQVMGSNAYSDDNDDDLEEFVDAQEESPFELGEDGSPLLVNMVEKGNKLHSADM